MRIIALGCLLVALSRLGTTTEKPTLESLYKAHRWFDLRDAIAGRQASPLYVGAVAAAFNDVVGAEKYLNTAIREAGNPTEVEQVRGILAYLYIRLGRHHDVLQQIDEMIKAAPQNSGHKTARSLFGVFGQYPNQSVGSVRHTLVHLTDEDGDLPVTVNGRTLQWFFDTGMNVSVISESEARMLDLKIEQSSADLYDLNGGKSSTRATVVPLLTVGDVKVRNVAFSVVPDTQPPMNGRKPGGRGIIGLPVMIALRNMRWTVDDNVEFGFNNSVEPTLRNSYFDGGEMITRVGFEGRQLDFVLDTGNGAGTQLWRSFAHDFPELVNQRGRSTTKDITQVGGSKDRSVVVLPEIRLTVGGLDTILRPANIFPKPVGNEHQYGLLGTDLLGQATRGMSIDFQCPSVRLQ